MQDKKGDLAICFFGMIAFILFFTPLFAIYSLGGGLGFVFIVLAQWMLSRKLWAQQFSTKKTLILWVSMSFLIILAVFLRDRVVSYFGKESWYHPITYYIYPGLASTFWWAMVEMLRRKKEK